VRPELQLSAPAPSSRPPLQLVVDGKAVEVADDGTSLLHVLREQLGLRAPKDGCSPQGQCGCCTVLVDGQPRVACVTPARRVRGRTITTLDGLPDGERAAWADAFCATGASQCGFCTPGIVTRLSALRARGTEPGDTAAVEQALLAHLCRCTGWRTIVDAWNHATSTPADAADAAGAADAADAAGARPAGEGHGPPQPRDLELAAQRATIEGRSPQRVGPEVALGQGGFADDTAPADALVAVPDGRGGWSVGETLAEARAASGKVQGRRTTGAVVPPLDLPPGSWDLTLRTSWVEPAYLETDASWCRPGDDPVSPLANGGAFGGKLSSLVTTAARELADRHGRPVRVLLSREDTVRLGPKRPPIAGGIRADGTGVLRVVRTPGVAAAVAQVAPALQVEEVDVPGPPTSTELRAAGWAEALILLTAVRSLAGEAAGAAGAPPAGTSPAAVQAGHDEPDEPDATGVEEAALIRGEATITSPDGATAWARVTFGEQPQVVVRVRCGRPLDEVVLRSYCVGAAHMGLSWVTSEGLAVDEEGTVHDLTVRSFGVLRAVDTPPIAVEIEPDDGPPVNGSDAVFVAVAAATWLAAGTPPAWPTGSVSAPVLPALS
jgi:xanthine dehydrogenase small subunit